MSEKILKAYGETIKFFDTIDPFFTTVFVNIGKPSFGTAESIGSPWAAVKKSNPELAKSPARLFLAPEFADLPVRQRAGVLSHEALHIILNHFAEYALFEDKARCTLAQELIVNDTTLENLMDLPGSVFFGRKVLGHSCAFMTTRDVYDELDRQEQEGNQAVKDAMESIRNHEANSCSGTSGNGDPVRADSGYVTLPSDLKIPNRLRGIMAGRGFSKRDIVAEKANINLTKLIREIDPDVAASMEGRSKTRADWSHSRRKLAGMNPRIMLPSHRPVAKRGRNYGFGRELVFAMDTSGSINDAFVHEVTNMAASIPTGKIKIHMCTFSDDFVPFTPGLNNQDIAQGGTDFEAIVRFIESENLDDPHVVVVTDGYARFSTHDRDWSKWHWLMIPGSPETEIGDSRVDPLNIYRYVDFIGDGVKSITNAV